MWYEIVLRTAPFRTVIKSYGIETLFSMHWTSPTVIVIFLLNESLDATYIMFLIESHYEFPLTLYPKIAFFLYSKSHHFIRPYNIFITTLSTTCKKVYANWTICILSYCSCQYPLIYFHTPTPAKCIKNKNSRYPSQIKAPCFTKNEIISGSNQEEQNKCIYTVSYFGGNNKGITPLKIFFTPYTMVCFINYEYTVTA